MNLFGWGSNVVRVDSMAAGCRLGENYVQSSIYEISGSGMACTIPSSRIHANLMEMLDTQLSVSIDNTLLDGILSWYTIEESTYRIGITIARKHRASWRKICAVRQRESMPQATSHASL